MFKTCCTLISIIIVIAVILAGCSDSLPAFEYQDTGPVNTVGAENGPAAPPNPNGSDSNFAAKPEFNFADANYHDLNSLDELRSTSDMVRNLKLTEDWELKNDYDKLTDISHIYINGVESIAFDGLCEIAGGHFDLTNDGLDDLILFIRPTMSNFQLGDLYVFRVNPAPEEILVFSGQFDIDQNLLLSNNWLRVPNDFPYNDASYILNYNELLTWVNVVEENGAYALQLIHDTNRQETAYSYIIWSEGWHFVKQKIVLQ